MDTKFCPDCQRIVTLETGIDVFGELRHRACVQQAAIRLIGDVFCHVDEEVRVAVRSVKKDWKRFVELLCLVANKLALGNALTVLPDQQRFFDVLFEKFVLPRFDATNGDLPREQTEKLRCQMMT